MGDRHQSRETHRLHGVEKQIPLDNLHSVIAEFLECKREPVEKGVRHVAATRFRQKSTWWLRARPLFQQGVCCRARLSSVTCWPGKLRDPDPSLRTISGDNSAFGRQVITLLDNLAAATSMMTWEIGFQRVTSQSPPTCSSRIEAFFHVTRVQPKRTESAPSQPCPLRLLGEFSPYPLLAVGGGLW